MREIECILSRYVIPKHVRGNLRQENLLETENLYVHSNNNDFEIEEARQKHRYARRTYTRESSHEITSSITHVQLKGRGS